MRDLHLHDFYRDCARILLLLLSTFPQRAPLYVEDLIDPEPADEFGLPSRRHTSAFAAMLWLAEEGWLRFHETIRQDGIERAVLTRTAFVALFAVDANPAHDGTPLAAALEAAVRQGSSSKIQTLMERLLSEFPHPIVVGPRLGRVDSV